MVAPGASSSSAPIANPIGSGQHGAGIRQLALAYVDDDVSEQSQLLARKAMAEHMKLSGSLRQDTAPRDVHSHRQVSDPQSTNVVDGSMEEPCPAMKQEEVGASGSRSMRHSDAMLTLKLVLISGKTAQPQQQQQLLVDVSDAISYGELRKLVQHRCGSRLSNSFRLLWLTRSGELVVLDQQTFPNYVLANWCQQPWTIYVQDERSGELSQRLLLVSLARMLFERYVERIDAQCQRRLDKRELLRLLLDLNLESLGCSVATLEGFVQSEFSKLGKESTSSVHTSGLTLDEFTMFVTSMAHWMRDELLIEEALDWKSVFALLLSKAVERPMASVLVPPAPNDDSGRHVYLKGVGDSREPTPLVYLNPARDRWIVETQCFGVRVELPTQSLLPGARLEVRFFTPTAVGYLMGRGLTRELMYTPIVRVDYPAFKDDADRPGIIGKPPPPFKLPLTLVLPHSFDASGGEESCLFMGAAHGATHWVPMHATNDVGSLYRDDLLLDERELRASIPFAGLFCAFAHPHVEVITAVRLHLYMRPEVRRDSPFSLRVYLCPELPTELEALALVEASQWGNSVRVGSSKLLFLCLGAKLRMSYSATLPVDRTEERHHGELVWQGRRTLLELTLLMAGDKGAEPAQGAMDRRDRLRGQLAVDVVAGVGKRASRTQAVARKAGIPETGYTVEFETRLQPEMRPDAPVLALLERTPHEFTVVWPKVQSREHAAENAAEITHYALELQMSAPSGSPYEWKELWCGAGHELVDFRALVNEEMARTRGDERALRDAQQRTKARRLNLTEALAKAKAEAVAKALAAGETSQGASPSPYRWRKRHQDSNAASAMGAAGAAEGGSESASSAPFAETAPFADTAPHADTAPAAEVLYGYSLSVDPSLFGRLRMRCWNNAEVRPSSYSNAVRLPQGVPGAGGGEPPPPKDVEQQLVEKARETYFGKQPQHVTDGGWPVANRIGNAPSRQGWGGDALLLSAPSSEQYAQYGARPPAVAMAPVPVPVPYDVPRLPVRDTVGLAKAGAALAAQYRSMGAEGGGGGLVFGLRIDHVLQAILGTPTANGQYSPRRTLSTLQQPLMAMCEVVYHDVLLPLLDSTRVLRSEWQLVGEKMAGVIPQIVSHACYYTLVKPHVAELLEILMSFYEMLRQCQHEQCLTFHLGHPEYSGPFKRQLRAEATVEVCALLWKLSTRMLEMQLDVAAHVAAQRPCDEIEPWRPPPSKLPPVQPTAGASAATSATPKAVANGRPTACPPRRATRPRPPRLAPRFGHVVVLDPSRPQYAGGGGNNSVVVYERQPTYEIELTQSMRARDALAQRHARALHLMGGRTDGVYLLEEIDWRRGARSLQREIVSMLDRAKVAPIDWVNAWRALATGGTDAGGTLGDKPMRGGEGIDACTHGGSVPAGDPMSSESTRVPTRHPLWRGASSAIDVNPKLFTCTDLESVVRAIVRPLDDGPCSHWQRLLVPAVLAMHRELRRKDELVESLALVGWLTEGWRRVFVLEHTPQPPKRVPLSNPPQLTSGHSELEFTVVPVMEGVKVPPPSRASRPGSASSTRWLGRPASTDSPLRPSLPPSRPGSAHGSAVTKVNPTRPASAVALMPPPPPPSRPTSAFARTGNAPTPRPGTAPAGLSKTRVALSIDGHLSTEIESEMDTEWAADASLRPRPRTALIRSASAVHPLERYRRIHAARTHMCMQRRGGASMYSVYEAPSLFEELASIPPKSHGARNGALSSPTSAALLSAVPGSLLSASLMRMASDAPLSPSETGLRTPMLSAPVSMAYREML